MDNGEKFRADSMEALRDAILMRGGIIPHGGHVHPSAASLADSDTALLKSMAVMLGSTGSGRAGALPAGALAFGIGTDEFAGSLADLMRSASLGGMIPHVAHRKIVDTRSVPNFLVHKFCSADIDVELVGELRELAEISHVVRIEDSAGVPGSIKTYGRNIGISRSLILADDIGLVASMATRAGAAAAHLEAQAVYGLLESNPTMTDGEAMFHAGHGNIQAAALDASALGAAIGQLRRMTTPAGAVGNLDAAFLVVEPDLEYTALKLVRDAALPVTVIGSAWLAAGRWYLMASPAAAPVVALLRLGRSRGDVQFWKTDKGALKNFDGVVMGVRFEFGVAPVGRMGAIRGGV